MKSERKRLLLLFIAAQILIAFVCFLTSVAIAVAFKTKAAEQTSAFIRRMVLIGDIRQTILTLSDFSSDQFAGVAYYDSSGEQVFFWPSSRSPEDFREDRKILSLDPYIAHESVFQLGAERSKQLGRAVYLINPFVYLPYAFAGILVLFSASLLILKLSQQKTRPSGR